MPINRRSQSRRAHVEMKAKERTAQAFEKQANAAAFAPIKEANKKQRGNAKKR